MKVNSLAFRLFATAAVWTLLVLPVAGLAIDYVRQRELATAHDARLSQLLTLIIAFSTDDGGPEPHFPRNVGEPLFEVTHSGWYWQITPLGASPGRRMVSASLASEILALPSASNVKPDINNIRWTEATGPLGEPLRVGETIFNLGDDEAPRNYSYVVAGNQDFIEGRLDEFRLPLVIALALAGLGLVGATVVQVHFGLRPLRAIEQGLADIRSGRARRLEGDLPAEIEPLRAELNALIQANQDTIERARTQVGNLAHALKTPLAVMINEAREERSPFGDKVVEQGDIMRDQINHYLDRARVAAQLGVIGTVTDVDSVLRGLIRAVSRIYRDRGIDIDVACAPGARFRGERQDLEEMLGNLLDNACKWAGSAVKVSAALREADAQRSYRVVEITVADDGPGLTAEQRAQAVKRGRRLDESKPGSGLGLSIVADLVQSYGGTFHLEAAPAGGLSARLVLPAA
ncbi:MAG: ATP-binding protein [Hyphomicrobiaceae bacterium]